MEMSESDQPWPIYALMENGKFVSIVAQHPSEPIVINITEDLAKMLRATEAPSPPVHPRGH
jgi:hypothetical protein